MKRYERYKESGIEWIGEIPERWRIKKIKHTTYVKGRIGWQGLRSDEFLELSDSLVVTGTDIKNRAVDWDSCYQIPIERYNEDPYIQLKENDLLITKDGTIGKVALVKNMPKIATLNSGIFVIRPSSNDYITEFMFWILNSNVFSSFFNYNKSGSTIQHLYQNVFNEFQFACPNLGEQVTISTYLNKLVSETDSLISKKKKLISLLKEERSAIINKAVTKGIDPNVKYKDSGIEWIGEIPEHWEVRRLKHVVKSNLKYGANEPAEYDNTDFPRYIRITDFGNDGKLKESTFKSLPFELAKHYMLENGDLLFARSGATVGKTFLFKDYKGSACFAGYLIKASFDNSKINSTLINYFTKSTFYENWVENMFQQATIQNIGADKYNQLQILVPLNISEQNEIVEYLDKKTKEIDIIIFKTEKEIALIKEYKNALINDVVIGKIDVRDAIEENQHKLQEAHQ